MINTIKEEKKSKKVHQSFALGALIMAVGMLIVKLAGAAFKIPLAYILGGVGQGYFNIAYSLYNPLYALATAGLPIAISRMVAQNMTAKRYKDVRMIHKVSVPIFIFTGLVATIFMVIGSPLCAKFTHSPGAIYSLLALAPTVLFSCLISIYKGYYEGLRNMIPTAISEIVEAIGKVVFGVGLSAFVVWYGMREYRAYGTVFGNYYESEALAFDATLPFASAGAVLGITLGSVSGFIYIFLKYKTSGDGITDKEIKESPEARDRKKIVNMLLNIAAPIALGAIIMNLAGAIDAMLVQRRLSDIMYSTPDILLRAYEGLIPNEVVAEKKTHNFLSGCFAYMSTITMLLPTITQGFSISALPNVTTSWVKGIKSKIKSNIETVMKLTSIISFPMGLGMSVLAHPIMDLVYNTMGKSRQCEIFISAEIMQLYALATILIAISTPICGMLQAVGRADLSLKILTIGMVLKVVLNYILVGIPEINIQGAGVGTLVCYLFVCVSGIILLNRETKLKLNLSSIFVKPLVCGLVCGAVAYLSHELFLRFLNPKFSTIIAIGIAAFTYLISLFLFRAITYLDLISIPKSKKIVKVLEKYHLLG